MHAVNDSIRPLRAAAGGHVGLDLVGKGEQPDLIYAFLEEYCATVPALSVVRNDIYARFSHCDYNKGSALGEIARLLGVQPEKIVAAGDHFNDLPMLSTRYAKWLIAPANAIPAVKETVRRQNGQVAAQPCGYGVAHGLRSLLKALA